MTPYFGDGTGLEMGIIGGKCLRGALRTLLKYTIIVILK